MNQNLTINEHLFVLHPSGAVFWETEQMLMISDVHLGKITHFRKYGTAVPIAAIKENFQLLDKTVQQFAPKTICFLGDLFHSYLNAEWHLFESWVTGIDASIILVSGNHDVISPSKYEQLGIDVVSEIENQGFLLTHHPEVRPNFFNFSGHIHPAIKLRGRGKQSLRLSCFYKTADQLVLPAFGTFTGDHVIHPKRGDQVFAIAQNQVTLVFDKSVIHAF